MKWYKYSFSVCCFISSVICAQPTFNSIDTLLTKNFEAVSLEDTVQYMALLNHSAIYKGKNVKTKADSLKVLKPFSEAFFDMIDELVDFAGNDDIEVKFESYKSHNTKEYDAKITGKIMLQVNLLINNTFTVTVPFMITGYNGKYAIENPMMVMFADN